MARQRWWSRLLFGPDVSVVHTHDFANANESPPIPDRQRIIRDWLPESGLSNATDEDVQFYIAALDAGHLNGRDVRKRGTPITAQEKAALGIKSRGILTREFLATLSAKGREDPEAAAYMIASPVLGRCSSARDLASARAAGIEKVRFRFGGMAAGHCSYSRRMDNKRVPIDEAELLPARECEHPDQCGCRWQDGSTSWTSWGCSPTP